VFAVIAVALFALALILNLANATIGTNITSGTLVDAGLLCVGLHMMGVAAAWNWRNRRSPSRRR
jgi:hypothetical protein